MINLKSILLLFILAPLIGCQPSIKFKHCRPDGSCTTLESRKEHPNGVSVKYDPANGIIDYQSGASITNTSDVAGIIELFRLARPGGVSWSDTGLSCEAGPGRTWAGL